MECRVGEEEAEWMVVLGDQCDFKAGWLGVVEIKERCSRNFVARCCHCDCEAPALVGDAEDIVARGGNEVSSSGQQYLYYKIIREAQ